MPNPLKSIAQVSPDKCYGCGACLSACAVGAISMAPDGTGFLRPVIDGDLCANCGACAGACPRLHPVYANGSPDKCLAVMAEDDIRRKSSSGGVFTLLAEYVLAKGGVVFGAAFTDGFLVRHVAVGSVDGLDALRGSKYAASDTGTTYAEAKRLLEAGRPVLYSGCPCQVAGLRSFLGRDYSNLLTVDILCSGTPSAYGLREYLDKTWGLANVASMRFRALEGWDYRFEVRLKSGDIVLENSFHGVCIPLIFGKDFAAVKNNEPERLEVLAREFGCGDRIFDSLDQVDVRRVASTHMDHDRILRLVDAERERGRRAVGEMLAAPAKPVVKAAPPVHGGTREPPEDPRAVVRFRAGVRREQTRCRDSKYLEYLSKIERPDLSSTILVQIAAYKDPEVVNMVKAALVMAANPDRLRFAVCLQDDDAGKLEELLSLPHVKVRYFPSSEAPGTCAARYYAQEFYDGEDFSFHTDSHMRFARFWDISMVEQWRLCGNEKAILTEYAMNLDPGWLDRPVDDPCFTAAAICHGVVTSAFFFSNNRPELRFRGHKTFVADRPRLGAFMCAHDMFCRGEVDRLVRFDRFMDFAGDEGAMSARLWTHGYDIYHPCVRTVFHLYERSGIYKSGSTLPDSQKVIVDGGISRWERQNRRMEKLFGMCDRADVDLFGFDLGFERTLADYEAFCGVDFRRLAIRAFAAGGFFDVPHGADDLAFVDWQQAYLDLYKAPVADVGRVLDVPVRQEVADAFMAFCAERHWQPQAALTEALRTWLGRF